MLFLSVICLWGLLHMAIELRVHRQMLQVLDQQREQKLGLQSTVHEEKAKMRHRYIGEGGDTSIDRTEKRKPKQLALQYS